MEDYKTRMEVANTTEVSRKHLEADKVDKIEGMLIDTKELEAFEDCCKDYESLSLLCRRRSESQREEKLRRKKSLEEFEKDVRVRNSSKPLSHSGNTSTVRNESKESQKEDGKSLQDYTRDPRGHKVNGYYRGTVEQKDARASGVIGHMNEAHRASQQQKRVGFAGRKGID